MLRYSYKVEAKALEAKLFGLELKLIKNPNNLSTKRLIVQLQQELDWYNVRIKNGEDPGVMIL